ncbi:MAG: hypothetical protein GC204_16815 [Chloroflexi bacterium]|nr:hypothetical protein [Chloroflexota bacterium]
MPTQIDWENQEHTIIRMEFIGRWTWQEAYEGSKTGFAMVDSVDHVVNVIIDMRQSTALPLLSLTHARNMIARRHTRTGLTVFIGANTLFLSLWKIFEGAYGQLAGRQNFAFARDVDEACQLFAERQGSLIQST